MAKGIYKRGNVYWIRYAGLDGKTVYESSGSIKFKQAEVLLISRKNSIKEGKQPEIKKIASHTFNGLVTEYSKWAERQRCFDSKIYLIRTKNGERREIPINTTLRGVLQNITRRLDVPNKDTLKPYSDVKRSFHTALRKAKIHDFTFHDTRHTFASHLVMAGVDLTTIKELLGHKTLSMTLRYAHLAPSHKVKALDLLDNTINGKKPTIQKLYNRGNQAVIGAM